VYYPYPLVYIYNRRYIAIHLYVVFYVITISIPHRRISELVCAFRFRNLLKPGPRSLSTHPHCHYSVLVSREGEGMQGAAHRVRRCDMGLAMRSYASCTILLSAIHVTFLTSLLLQLELHTKHAVLKLLQKASLMRTSATKRLRRRGRDLNPCRGSHNFAYRRTHGAHYAATRPAHLFNIVCLGKPVLSLRKQLVDDREQV
jgi:hypothetical protein